MKHTASPTRFVSVLVRSAFGPLAWAFFLLFSGACFGATAPTGNIYSEPETISVKVRHTIQPDKITRLPCTDQFASDLAELDWRSGAEADTGWQAAFSIAIPVFTAYKRYKDCLKAAYPGAENTPR